MYGRSFWQEGGEAPERLAQRGGGCLDRHPRSGWTRLRAASSGGKSLLPAGSAQCGSRCPFRIPTSSNDLMILCRMLVGRTGTAMDTRNKHYGMRAGQLQQAAAAATNILTRERRQGSQRAPGRPLVPLGTPPCPAARGPAGEEQGEYETSL